MPEGPGVLVSPGSPSGLAEKKAQEPEMMFFSPREVYVDWATKQPKEIEKIYTIGETDDVWGLVFGYILGPATGYVIGRLGINKAFNQNLTQEMGGMMKRHDKRLDDIMESHNNAIKEYHNNELNVPVSNYDIENDSDEENGNSNSCTNFRYNQDEDESGYGEYFDNKIVEIILPLYGAVDELYEKIDDMGATHTINYNLLANCINNQNNE